MWVESLKDVCRGRRQHSSTSLIASRNTEAGFAIFSRGPARSEEKRRGEMNRRERREERASPFSYDPVSYDDLADQPSAQQKRSVQSTLGSITRVNAGPTARPPKEGDFSFPSQIVYMNMSEIN